MSLPVCSFTLCSTSQKKKKKSVSVYRPHPHLQTTPMCCVVVEQTTDGQIDAGEALLLRVTLPLFSASWRHCWALTMKVHSPWITHSCSHIGGLNRWSQGYRQKRGSHSINSIPISSGRFLMVHLHTHTHTSPHTVLFLSCAPHWGPMWTIWSVYMASMPGGRSPQCPLCAHCENVWLRCVCVCVFSDCVMELSIHLNRTEVTVSQVDDNQPTKDRYINRHWEFS